MIINLKALKETEDFYKLELEREDLAGGERDSYLKALKLIEGFIEKEEAGEKGKNKNMVIRKGLNSYVA